METELLEREPYLAQLGAQLEQAVHGAGRAVLVSGEAGIGKTTLVERFTQHQRNSARTLWGACEALFTPRPLGPLHDIAQATQGELHALLERGADRPALFAALLDELRHAPRPTIVVFEDVHWADEATLDLIKFLGRRIHQTATLFILTYRDDEIGRDHPLRYVLGDLPTRAATRISLPPLSAAGVAALAQAAHRPADRLDRLYVVTGGNPFFVTEALASTAPGVPVTVRDAVLARVGRLPETTRRVVELVSVAPARMEYALIAAVVGADAVEAALDPALTAGILHQEDEAVAFRHELARQAVEGALAPLERRALHARVLSALLAGDTGEGVQTQAQAQSQERAGIQVARLVHHAEHAGDREHVLRYAPQAAREAAAHGAHREAAAHYATALRYGGGLPLEQRAELLEGLAYQCYLTGQGERAIQAREAALAIWRGLDSTEKVGHNLRWLSRQSWFLNRAADADRYAAEAVRLLEGLPPSSELAMAYSNRAQLAMNAYKIAGTLHWGSRAIELAEQLGDVDTVTHALNNMGTALLQGGDERGRPHLERSLSLALDHGFEEHVARAYTNLACIAVEAREYALAAQYLDAGIDYCTERDLDSWRMYMLGWRAQAHLEQGRWTAADEDATAVLASVRALPASRIPALVALGRVRSRRGDPGAREVLDEARERALASGELQRIGPAAAARAEAAWLHGDLVGCVAEARSGFELALAHEDQWIVSELACWMWRGGAIEAPVAGAAEPFALQMRGDWRAAAAAWERLGCPYERALALADGDEPAQREALAIFEGLGARPAAELVRRHLREQGVRGVARGPRSATRANPYSLTNRQLEIVRLLAEGLRNAEIAERLSTSAKTVDHHVSAVLGKLGVRSRAEAIALAHQMGILGTVPANVGSAQGQDG
jgi:predicted ATPase/DNA-binding CsgD family transcriptional regulator